jgi:hypothetical protein
MFDAFPSSSSWRSVPVPPWKETPAACKRHQAAGGLPYGMQQFRNRTVTGLKRVRAGEQGKWIRVKPQNTPPKDIKGFSEVFNPLIALGINPIAKKSPKSYPRPLRDRSRGMEMESFIKGS